jgi:hypothetical protein
VFYEDEETPRAAAAHAQRDDRCARDVVSTIIDAADCSLQRRLKTRRRARASVGTDRRRWHPCSSSSRRIGREEAALYQAARPIRHASAARMFSSMIRIAAANDSQQRRPQARRVPPAAPTRVRGSISVDTRTAFDGFNS